MCTFSAMTTVARSYCSRGSHFGEARETVIGDNVFIGAHSIVLMGSHIGADSIIGAGAVVSGTWPEGSVIAGNPARLVCTLDEFAEKRERREPQAPWSSRRLSGNVTVYGRAWSR